MAGPALGPMQKQRRFPDCRPPGDSVLPGCHWAGLTGHSYEPAASEQDWPLDSSFRGGGGGVDGLFLRCCVRGERAGCSQSPVWAALSLPTEVTLTPGGHWLLTGLSLQKVGPEGTRKRSPGGLRTPETLPWIS